MGVARKCVSVLSRGSVSLGRDRSSCIAGCIAICLASSRSHAQPSKLGSASDQRVHDPRPPRPRPHERKRAREPESSARRLRVHKRKAV